jgi:hypothetical protein
MDILEWGNISTGVYVVLTIVLLCMYVVIFHLDKIIGDENAKLAHDYTEECAVSCSDKVQCETVNSYRDEHYYLFDGNSKKCLVTKWEISHLITHIFLGYFTNIYISQGLSVGFEIYEHYSLDCGSYIDLGYNFIGFVIGHNLKKFTR